ncbi:putative transposase/invertase (TIGR01784 family) [Anseongella ginsenosidimutans]|uniref:Putative transposase/invertase (TIGR01784 family) n=1 Tax=Anseongella ginsenosidimutans TaxID=496056 RepID=A0A4R3KPS3_9SPHI|nr:PD-(D/E)XK nuclease family transposase [Anseongella ginsenosidimutans]QEC52184.1 hypothetical protein FRZ59_07420 [Anseongella ginsenosidimutans]TCS86726.1 putative transposase/invertase (TIGR01784 family) [Anseongella ginsenosidimutans]
MYQLKTKGECGNLPPRSNSGWQYRRESSWELRVKKRYRSSEYSNSGKDHSYPASFELILVELPRFTKTIAELQTNLDKWLYLMKALPHLQEQPSSFQGPLFEKLFQLTDYNKLKEDQKMTIDYDRDLRSIASASKREGRQEGLREGIQQQKHSSVLALIKQTDLNDQKIASIEGVEESFVRRVRAER